MLKLWAARSTLYGGKKYKAHYQSLSTIGQKQRVASAMDADCILEKIADNQEQNVKTKEVSYL